MIPCEVGRLLAGRHFAAGGGALPRRQQLPEHAVDLCLISSCLSSLTACWRLSGLRVGGACSLYCSRPLEGAQLLVSRVQNAIAS